jgi:hypothetical protein
MFCNGGKKMTWKEILKSEVEKARFGFGKKKKEDIYNDPTRDPAVMGYTRQFIRYLNNHEMFGKPGYEGQLAVLQVRDTIQGTGPTKGRLQREGGLVYLLGFNAINNERRQEKRPLMTKEQMIQAAKREFENAGGFQIEDGGNQLIIRK